MSTKKRLDSGSSTLVASPFFNASDRDRGFVYSNTNVTNKMPTTRVLEYLDPLGRSPYAKWFDGLNAEAAAKVASALYRLADGNFSNVKGVGGGVLERKIDSDRVTVSISARMATRW